MTGTGADFIIARITGEGGGWEITPVAVSALRNASTLRS
jgi:hypothetical protein